MKTKTLLTVTLGLAFTLCFAVVPFSAQAQSDDDQINESVASLNEEAATPEGQQAVVRRLKDRYNVEEQTINQLRDKNFGYGEISSTLSLAEGMDGGINDENIQSIVDMRTGDNKMGWGQIAQEHGVKISDLKRNMKSLNTETINNNEKKVNRDQLRGQTSKETKQNFNARSVQKGKPAVAGKKK